MNSHGVLFIRPPLSGRSYVLTTETLEELLTRLNIEIHQFKTVTRIFVGIAAVLLGVAAYEWYREYKTKRDRWVSVIPFNYCHLTSMNSERASRSSQEHEAMNATATRATDGNPCVVCLVNTRNVVILVTNPD